MIIINSCYSCTYNGESKFNLLRQNIVHFSHFTLFMSLLHEFVTTEKTHLVSKSTLLVVIQIPTTLTQCR